MRRWGTVTCKDWKQNVIVKIGVFQGQNHGDSPSRCPSVGGSGAATRADLQALGTRGEDGTGMAAPGPGEQCQVPEPGLQAAPGTERGVSSVVLAVWEHFREGRAMWLMMVLTRN